MTRGMTPDDLFRIQWLSDVRLSPAAERAAFTLTRLDQAADDYRSSVWVVATNGGAPVQFTNGGGRDHSPRWSPDGSRLAFLSDREGGKAQVHVMDAHGGEARKLTDVPQGVSGLVWSPDSTRLVIVVRTGGEADEPPGSKPKAKPARLITTLKHKMNGEGFTYDRRRHLFLVDAASGDTRQLTDGDWDDTQPAWSPDSRRIAFVSARHAGRDFDRANGVYVVDSQGGDPVCITPPGVEGEAPAWSPDGARIAWLGVDQAEDPPRNARLWLSAAGGGEPRLLTATLDRNLSGEPAWSSDGATIRVGVEDRGTQGVSAVTVSDGAVSTVVAGARIVSSFAVSASADRCAFIASDATHPGELFWREPADERRLTGLNDAWLAEVSLAPARHFTVETGGYDIDAWIMLPPGYQSGRRYPALLNIHGGPFVQYGVGFFDEFQVQAGAGYVVVYANPRGSSGREEAFARALIGDPAAPMAADVLACLDTALAQDESIDPQHTGVLGGSYGGYLTAWIIGETDRFAAACAERGIYNRYSRETTGDIPTAYTYLRVRTWEDPALYWQHSPIRRVKEMRTPLLIMHSEEDLRCPIEQAEQLFIALKQQRRDVRFVRFPGENHELSRTGKPSHRVQRFQFQLEFFGEKLSPGQDA